ncbi:MAG: hypothetical protein O2955_00090 [Planctomycetota bacterium]|nr:hypothetical protein [Planctomycetota bacterium]MDA1210879.1 hypothetical protein [Planctomycetota bacterium]
MTLRKRTIIAGLIVSSFLCTMRLSGYADDEKKEPTAEKKNLELTQDELENRFAEQLTGAALVGSFTVAGQENKTPHEERYELKKVEKARGDLWTFTARIKYGKNDVEVPMTLKVLWAGDTPVITLTDLTIPGLGTFTARVMFYGDRYAGTWQHGEVGGHMWGVIEAKVDEDK